MLGVAAGLATMGLIPFISTFVSFAVVRPLDQIRVLIAQTGANVKITPGYAGLFTGQTGMSHIIVDDLTIMRAMPGMVSVAPADDVEAAAGAALGGRLRGSLLRPPRPRRDAAPLRRAPRLPLREGRGRPRGRRRDPHQHRARRRRAPSRRPSCSPPTASTPTSSTWPTLKPLDVEAIVAAAERTGPGHHRRGAHGHRRARRRGRRDARRAPADAGRTGSGSTTSTRSRGRTTPCSTSTACRPRASPSRCGRSCAPTPEPRSPAGRPARRRRVSRRSGEAGSPTGTACAESGAVVPPLLGEPGAHLVEVAAERRDDPLGVARPEGVEDRGWRSAVQWASAPGATSVMYVRENGSSERQTRSSVALPARWRSRAWKAASATATSWRSPAVGRPLHLLAERLELGEVGVGHPRARRGGRRAPRARSGRRRPRGARRSRGAGPGRRGTGGSRRRRAPRGRGAPRAPGPG